MLDDCAERALVEPDRGRPATQSSGWMSARDLVTPGQYPLRVMTRSECL